MTVYADRVKETSTSTGTGTITLAGAVSGFQSFTSAFSTGSVVTYCIDGGAEWEVGRGVFTTSGTTLSRTTVLASSNANALVSFSAGSKTVFDTFAAADIHLNNVGSTEIDFGAFPGVNEISATVTGQSGIIAGSKILVSVSREATADHTVGDAAYAATLIGVSAGNISAATGFTIYARSIHKMQGKFVINWSWT
jgi:hypothetical protein